MDKAKILRQCNEIERAVNKLYVERQDSITSEERIALINMLGTIVADITAPPKSNADRIRQMTDEELAKFMRSCNFCAYLDKGCQHNGTCTQGFLEWLKQEVSEDAGND